MPHLPLSGRHFLFLQGPQSRFFRTLAQSLREQGAKVHKVNVCGGDVFLWGWQSSFWYRKSVYQWPSWISDIFRKNQITDICLYGDWRPLHWEAVRLARYQNIRIWVYEEGYLRSHYSTLEENGVNGRSLLPKTAKGIRDVAHALELDETEYHLPNNIHDKVISAIFHHVGNFVLWPFFYHYRTHRPTNIAVELLGILPRFIARHRRERRSETTLAAFYEKKPRYFFFPLQLNSDSQIQLYSPYVRIHEAIAGVLTSFALHAPKDVSLLIKNHPLDNGLMKHGLFIKSFAKELGIADRVVYVEDGSTHQMVKDSQGVVLVNSTVGLSALEEEIPVYCLGQCIYNIEGLTQSMPKDSLNRFWVEPKVPDRSLFLDFKKVLQAEALVRGNFYSDGAIELAVSDSIARFLMPLRNSYDITQH